MTPLNKSVIRVLLYVLALLLIITPTLFLSAKPTFAYPNPGAVNLLTVKNFAALAKTSVTSPTGPTVLNNGDLGIDSPGTCTDFPSPCSAPNANGTINNGAIQFQNSAALTGQTDATALVTDLNGRASNATLLAQLGGQTLTQGVYDVPAAGTNLTGDLTLSGDANSIFIFRLSSTLITDTGSRVVLTGGVQACNVFWTVGSSATFNGTTNFVGTVLAHTSTTFPGGGGTLNGRVVAQTAAITFNNTTVNNTSCASTSGSDSNLINANVPGSSTMVPASVCPTIEPVIQTPQVIEMTRLSPTSIYVSWGPYSGTNTFNVRYGTTKDNLLYNVDVTGFNTTLNYLPANTPIWVEVAARNSCTIGTYGNATTGGSPRLPNTGLAAKDVSWLWSVLTLVGVSTLLIFVKKKQRI